MIEKKQELIRKNHRHYLYALDKKFEKGLISKRQWQKERMKVAGEFGQKRAELDEELSQTQLAYFNSKEYEMDGYRKNLKDSSNGVLMIQQILEKCKGFSDKAWMQRISVFYYFGKTGMVAPIRV